MGSAEWKSNPQAAKGALRAGVLRDGDWNIAMKWGAENQIKNNPDEKTWDADALNWVNAPDYLKAAEIYNANTCEDRKVVKDGRLTGETKNVCVNGVVTWTPGDVNVAHGRGGLVSIVSSRQYRSQMPDVIICIKKFKQDNPNQRQGSVGSKIHDMKEILDTSYILGASSQLAQSGAEPDIATFSSSGSTGNVVSKRNWNIEFDTGKATFTAEGERNMYQIKDDLAIAGALFITVNGYTDSVGSRSANLDLSSRRAMAVKEWLQRKAPTTFPENRFRVHAFGDDNPVASNATAEGRAKNRRVEIILSANEWGSTWTRNYSQPRPAKDNSH